MQSLLTAVGETKKKNSKKKERWPKVGTCPCNHNSRADVNLHCKAIIKDSSVKVDIASAYCEVKIIA